MDKKLTALPNVVHSKRFLKSLKLNSILSSIDNRRNLFQSERQWLKQLRVIAVAVLFLEKVLWKIFIEQTVCKIVVRRYLRNADSHEDSKTVRMTENSKGKSDVG